MTTPKTPSGTHPVLSADGRTLSVTIPFAFRRRGGRKLIIGPDGTPGWQPPPRAPDNTLIKALARAHRWQRRLDSGRFASIKELADAEGLADRYLAKLLRLTLLAPDIIEMILDGRQPKGIQLADFMGPWPLAWPAQRDHLQRLATR